MDVRFRSFRPPAFQVCLGLRFRLLGRWGLKLLLVVAYSAKERCCVFFSKGLGLMGI